MKLSNIKKLFLAIAIVNLSSCSFFNSNYAEIKVNSNPQGARIMIEGRQVGITPSVVKIPVKNYMMTLTKDGFGSAVVDLQTWASIKTSANNKIVSDGYRCLLDSLNPLLFFTVFTKNCKDFKIKNHQVNIIQNSQYDINNNSSMIGIGNVPQNMIQYHYSNQDSYSR